MPKNVLRLTALLVVSCLVAEPVMSSVGAGIPGNHLRTVNTTFGIHSPLRFQEEAIPAALSYVAHPFEIIHAAWARVALRFAARSPLTATEYQERIDRISVYGVSWWFEPFVALGLFCFAPWAVAAAFQLDVAHFLPGFAAFSHVVIFVGKHWEGVYESQEDGHLEFKHFQGPEDSWATGMVHRWEAWKVLFWEGLVFHAPFYLAFVRLDPHGTITAALHQLALPFAWALFSHLGSHLLPLVSVAVRRWNWVTAASDISRPRKSQQKATEGLVKRDEPSPLSNEALIWMLVEMLKFRSISTVWSDGEDNIYFQHNIQGVAPHAGEVPAPFREKFDREGVEFWYVVHKDAKGHLDDVVDWYIRLPPETPEPLHFLHSLMYVLTRTEFGSEPIAGDWVFVERLFGIFGNKFSPAEIAQFAQVTHQDLHGIRYAVQMEGRGSNLKGIEIKRIRNTLHVYVPEDYKIDDLFEKVKRWFSEAEKGSRYHEGEVFISLLAEHIIWRTLAGLEKVVIEPLDTKGVGNKRPADSIRMDIRIDQYGEPVTGETPLTPVEIREGVKKAKEYERSKNGRYVVINRDKESSRIIDLRTKKEVELEMGPFTRLGPFSPTSDVVLAHRYIGKEYVMVLLDLKAKRGEAVLHRLMAKYGKIGNLVNVRFSERGTYWEVASNGYKDYEVIVAKTMRRWRLPKGKHHYFTSDEKRVVFTPVEGGDARMIDIGTGRRVPLPKGTTGVAFLDKPSRILAYRHHGWATVYDLISKQTIVKIENLYASDITLAPDTQSAVVVLNTNKIPKSSPNAVLWRYPDTVIPLEGIVDDTVDKVKFSANGTKVTLERRFRDEQTYSTLTGRRVKSYRATWGLTRWVTGVILNWVSHIRHPRPARSFSQQSVLSEAA